MVQKKEEFTETDIRILIVEDQPTDAELILREISNAGFRFTSQLVDTKQDFLDALKNFNPGIILSDYVMPMFNGMLALQLAKEFDPSIPFIIVTGSMNEETAVECMKAGADDYVIKEHISTISTAIKDAFEKKNLREEKRKAEENLRRNEEQFRLLTENIADMIAVLDCEGNRIYNSPSYKEILGNLDKLHGTDSFMEIHNEDKEKIRKIFFETVKTGVGQRAEFRLIGKDGNIYFIESQGSVIKDENGKTVNVVVVSRNVTERKLNEKILQEKEEFLNSIIENIPHMIFIKDAKDLRFVRLNKACELEWGFKREELIGKNDHDFFPENEAGYFINIDREVLDKKQIINIPEESIQTKFIGKRILHTKKIPILDNKGDPQFLLGISEDITERKRVEEALVQEQYLMKMLMDNIPHQIYFKDTESRFLRMNNAQARRFGLSNPAEAYGKTDFDFFTENHARPAYEDEQKIIRTGKPIIGMEEIETWSDGHSTWAETTKMPLRDKDGRIIGTFGISFDITERKQAEEKINLLAHTIKSVNECISITDLNDTILFVNEAFLSTYEYTENEILGKNIKIIRSPNNPSDNHIEIARIARETSWHGELLNITKNGREFPIILSTSIVRNESGQAVALVGVASDITERKLAEQALKESEERYRFIVEATCDVIYQIKYNSKEYDYINPTIEKLTGYTSEEINSMGFSSIIEKVKNLDSEKVKANITLNVDEWRTDYQVRTKTGKLIWISDTSYPWLNQKNVPIGRIGILRDITDRIQAQEEIIKAKEKAEEMNRLKSSFLANMSHELRTPLIGILGFADILKDESKEQEQKEIAETILESGNRLRETLNLILDLSKVEAETLKTNFEEIEINEFIKNRVSSFKDSFHKKGLKLKAELSDEPVYSNLDKVLFNSVIDNLLNNAIKFTDKGEVVINVNKLKENNMEIAEIIVKDTGIGILKENLEVIFEPFRQASEGYTRKFEGTGLGLTLVKKYVKNMHGEISVESEIGKGSEFKIRFPAIAEPAKKEQKFGIKEIIRQSKIDNNAIEKPLIMYVDDDSTTRSVIKRFLNNYCVIDEASNGEDAVKYATMKKYDLIFMDINLGRGMSGLTAAVKIKELHDYKNTPIIAVTAYALAGDKEKFTEHGCTHYLAKPFIKEQIISLINNILKLELTI
jgi:PAS domain S-box-containing protein